MVQYKEHQCQNSTISNVSKELQQLNDIINGRVTTPLAIVDKERPLSLEDKKESKKRNEKEKDSNSMSFDTKESKKLKMEQTVTSSNPRMNSRKKVILQKKKESAIRRLQGSIVDIMTQTNTIASQQVEEIICPTFFGLSKETVAVTGVIQEIIIPNYNVSDDEEEVQKFSIGTSTEEMIIPNYNVSDDEEEVPKISVRSSMKEMIIPNYNRDEDSESEEEIPQKSAPVRRHVMVKSVKKNRNIAKEEAAGWIPVLNKEQRKSKMQTLLKKEQKAAQLVENKEVKKENKESVTPTPIVSSTKVPISPSDSSTSDKWFSSEDEADSKNVQPKPVKGWDMSRVDAEINTIADDEEEIDMELVEPELLTWNVIPCLSDIEGDEWELC